MFTADDKKKCLQLIGLLKMAHFKELTVMQSITIGIVISWVESLLKRIDESLSSASEAEKSPKVTPIKKDKK